MTPSPPIVTLLSDFGYSEPFVGIMKGVILRTVPQAQLVDLSHDIPAQDISVAGFWLAKAIAWFPNETVHLAVVDPGVGTSRRALVVRCLEQWLVVPDNGLITEVAEGHGLTVFQVEAPAGASATFHGRDVFAPWAAKLAAGQVSTASLGAPVDDWVRLDRQRPTVGSGFVEGQVVASDRFGNLISNITPPGGVRLDGCELLVPERQLRVPIVANYSAGQRGELVAVVNAWDLIEVCVNQGHAQQQSGLVVGQVLRLRWAI